LNIFSSNFPDESERFTRIAAALPSHHNIKIIERTKEKRVTILNAR